MTKFDINDFVLVNPERGKTPGMARITKICENEAEIVFDNGEKAKYYFVHLYRTGDCVKRKQVWLKKRASKIGRKS